MQNHWTKDDVAAAWKRFEHTYAHDPVAYRFLCGHCIQDETDEDSQQLLLFCYPTVCRTPFACNPGKSTDRFRRLSKFSTRTPRRGLYFSSVLSSAVSSTAKATR